MSNVGTDCRVFKERIDGLSYITCLQNPIPNAEKYQVGLNQHRQISTVG